MSMSSDHCQSIADKIAIDDYAHLFEQLPKSVQDEIWKQAVEKADKEIRDLVR